MTAKRLGFPKSRRLTRPADFESVKKDGRAERGRLLVLSVLSETHQFRAGFVTSRAIGGAVARNRVRRRLREIVRRHQHEIRGPRWLVTIARVEAASATFDQLEAEWLRLARRASILAA
jgi:ribonuclease P protein component